MALWQKIICYSGLLTVIDIDMEDSPFKSNLSHHHGTAIRFLELLMDEIEILEEHLTKVEYNRLRKKPRSHHSI